MRIKIYAPAEYNNALMYDDTDKSVEKIIGDDILNIVNKTIDMGEDYMITYVEINVENHILNTLDPVYPICYGKYIINIHLIDINMRAFEFKYSLETEAMLYPKKGKGIENDNTGETIVDHESSIEFTRNLYQIYNFTLNDYLRNVVIKERTTQLRQKIVKKFIEEEVESAINEKGESISEETREALRKEMEPYFVEIKPKKINKRKRYRGSNNGNNYRHKIRKSRRGE